ncbi:hypothetical protein MRB53_031088 [Persea americana]|uniref:Uncharacterized protein n=1 Tax=Persea americana TaxID=3435 RepID=A0ACC2KNK7_PERAE|nr:hypothetical protein MRB53_031088 [Persea americana]
MREDVRLGVQAAHLLQHLLPAAHSDEPIVNNGDAHDPAPSRANEPRKSYRPVRAGASKPPLGINVSLRPPRSHASGPFHPSFKLPRQRVGLASSDGSRMTRPNGSVIVGETNSPYRPESHRLADSLTVARSAFWNIAGRAGPMVIALVATPYLFAELGPTRWGLFALALSLIGIFGIFDFGIGRALTKLLAERVATGEIDEAAALTRTGLVLLTLLGIAGAAILAGFARLWVDHGLHVAPGQRDEVLHALYVLCLAVPFVILNAALWGVISAFQKFKAANLVNMPILAFYYVGPLLVLRMVDSLVVVMLVLVACRIVMTICYWRICLAEMPSLRSARADRRHARSLAQLGGWMTVALGGGGRLLRDPERPARAHVPGDRRGDEHRLSRHGRRVPPRSGEGGHAGAPLQPRHRGDAVRAVALRRRLQPRDPGVVGRADFADHAAPVMRWLALAMILGAADAVVSGFVDSIGRPDFNAKFSLAELAFYVPLLAVLLKSFGIQGAAIAWSLRVGTDLVVRMLIAGRLVPLLRPVLARLLCVVAVATAALALPLAFEPVVERLVAMALSTAFFAVALWTWGADAEERAFCTIRLRQRGRLHGLSTIP